jgi:hypothetical protein
MSEHPRHHAGGDCDLKGDAWYEAHGYLPAAPFGMATCLNCGDRFFPGTDPNEMFCDPDCGQQYCHGLGL